MHIDLAFEVLTLGDFVFGQKWKADTQAPQLRFGRPALDGGSHIGFSASRQRFG